MNAKASRRFRSAAPSSDTARSLVSHTRGAGPGLVRLLASPVDAASLALFRIAFGLVLAWEAIRYLWPMPQGNWVYLHYVKPVWNIPYHGFEWVRPLPEPWLTTIFVLWGLVSLAMAAGLLYRATSIATFVLTTYVFLLEAAHYLNHFYLMCLVAFLLTMLPADRLWSLDRWLWPDRRLTAQRPETTPFWSVFVLRFQLFVVYFFGGIAKIDANWLSGDATFPAARRAFGWLEPALIAQGLATLKTWFDVPQLAQFLAISGLGYDLGIGFLLIWRRTRYFGLALTAFFHLFNSQAFNIGVFPVLAFTSTLIFCEPDWPRRFAVFIRRPRISRPDWGWLVGGAAVAPGVGLLLGWRARRAPAMNPVAPRRLTPAVAWLLGAWVAVQVLLPLRHFAIPGDAAWTEEGHRFAWRMMLRGKEGYLRLNVFDPALVTADASGAVNVNWPEYTRCYPKLMFVEVNSPQVDWASLPSLVVVFEPLLGERIVLNHLSSEAPNAWEAPALLAADWQAKYGHLPVTQPSEPLVKVLAALRRDLVDPLAAMAPEDRKICEASLREVDRLAALMPADFVAAETRSVDLAREIERLLLRDDVGELTRIHLLRVHPFTLQGGEHKGSEFVLVDDPALVRLTEKRRREIDRTAWRHTELVHADLVRVNRDGWQCLPQVIVTSPEGQPRFEWNLQRHLTGKQVSQVQQLPFMAHEMAQKIAGAWEADFGRRPIVSAACSQTVFNRRLPQSMIDPAADLASAPLHLFSHNEWILPLDQDRPLQQTLRPEEVSGYASGSLDDPGRASTVRYPNGLKHSEEYSETRNGVVVSVTQAWREEGRLMLRAERVGGQRHGLAQRWHPNGRLALEVRYERGRRHGRSTLWYENGVKCWEGEYRDGVLEGLATSWNGDGSIAQRETYSAGQLAPASANNSAAASASLAGRR